VAAGHQDLTADDVIARLGLAPLELEGGYFRETYRSGHATAIYYLLTPSTFSHLHRLAADEVFHFYAGDPVEMLHLGPDGGRRLLLGGDLGTHACQVVVPAGTWQGARLVPGGRWALMGTTMAPPFELAGYTHGRRAELLAAYPAHAELIVALTAPEA